MKFIYTVTTNEHIFIDIGEMTFPEGKSVNDNTPLLLIHNVTGSNATVDPLRDYF